MHYEVRRSQTGYRVSLACPRLFPHHGVVTEHLHGRRVLRQQSQLLGRPCLELHTVPNDRRTGTKPASIKTARRAAAEPDRRETEDDAPRPRASAFVSHGFSPWSRAVGLNHRTESLSEAVAFDAEQGKILEWIDAAEAAAQIVRQIRDGSEHSFWPAPTEWSSFIVSA